MERTPIVMRRPDYRGAGATGNGVPNAATGRNPPRCRGCHTL